MTRVRPFRALRYDPKRVSLDRVIVPPYDVVTAEERAFFWDRDPHSALRVDLAREGGGEPDYAEAARELARWEAEGVLLRDPAPALYGLRQRFVAPDGTPTEREGFFALLHLEDYASRVVRPHERTLAGPKQDRLRHLRATRANCSSVFLLYEDREQRLAEVLSPGFETSDRVLARDVSGIEHELAPIASREIARAVAGFLAERPVVIADGHHRYETALAYREEQRRAESGAGPDAPFEWVLAYFANAYAPGSLLLPIHRVVLGPAPDAAAWRERLGAWREGSVAHPGPDAIDAVLARELAPHAPAPAFAADDGSGRLRVFWRERVEGELAIQTVHREVIEGVFGLGPEAVSGGAVTFAKLAREAARAVRAGRGGVALYLNALRPEDVFRVTGAGELLPQKSTLFMPKLPTGLVFRRLEDDAR
jgi:uncharacterized protein (DUF1015 family)